MTISLEDWLALPLEDLAAQVHSFDVSAKIAMDGSTRHYLLHNPNPMGEVIENEKAAYFQHGLKHFMRVVDLMLSCGVSTLIMLAIWPPDLDRREDHLRQNVQYSKRLLLSEEALLTFKRRKVRSRLFGNYDVSPILESVRSDIEDLARELEVATPVGEQLVLWGFSGGSGLDELIARSVALHQTLGRLPTEEELRSACFPLGPSDVDIYIGTGWLRIGNIDLPPVLNQGNTDLYSLCHLPFDLTEAEVRRILYDHLFLRHQSSPADVVKYTPEVLSPLQAYYAGHGECIIGFGHVVGQGFWYPDHAHGVESNGTAQSSKAWSSNDKKKT